MLADGVTPAPSWITVIANGDGTFSIQVDKDANDGQAPDILDLKLVATVDGKTTAQKSVDWKLTMYTFVPVDPLDQLYLMDAAQLDYTFPAFILTPSDVGIGNPGVYDIVYSLVLASNPSVLCDDLYDWLTFDSDSRLISIVETIDSSAGIYNCIIVGTLDDPNFEVASADITFTLLDIIPAPQDDILYFVTDTPWLEDIEPFSQFPNAPAFPDEMIDYSLSLTSGAPVPGFIYLNADGKIEVSSINAADAGVYNVRLTGALGQYTSLTDSANFKVTVVSVTPQPLAVTDIVYFLGKASVFEPYVPFTYGPLPADGGPTLTFTYSLQMQNGDPVPSWVHIDTATGRIVVDQNLVATPFITYQLNLIATVNNYPTGFSTVQPFGVKILANPLVSSVVPDYEYSISYNAASGGVGYSFPLWQVYPATLGYQITYNLEHSDGSPLTESWIQFNPVDNLIYINTADENLQNVYQFALRGTLDDPLSSTEAVPFTVVLVDIVPTTQPLNMVFLLGGGKLKKPITDFFQTPNDPAYINTYDTTYSIDVGGSSVSWVSVGDQQNYEFGGASFTGSPGVVEATITGLLHAPQEISDSAPAYFYILELLPLPLNIMWYELGAIQTTQSFAVWLTNPSNSDLPENPLQWTYSCTNKPFASIVSALTIGVQTTDFRQLGKHDDVILKGALTNFNPESNYFEEYFTVIIYRFYSVPLPDVYYGVGNTQISLTLPKYYVSPDNVGIEFESYSLYLTADPTGPLPSFIKFQPSFSATGFASIQVFTSDENKCGVYKYTWEGFPNIKSIRTYKQSFTVYVICMDTIYPQDQVYVIGGASTVYYFPPFKQTPGNSSTVPLFNQTYLVIDQSTGKSIGSFSSFPEMGKMVIKTGDERLEGVYTVVIQSTMWLNPYQNIVVNSFPFNITLFLPPVAANLAPDFLDPKLVNWPKIVNMPTDTVFYLDVPYLTDPNGDAVTIDFNFGQAGLFMSYDELTHVLKIDTLAAGADPGMYPIVIKICDDNALNRLCTTKTLIINIGDYTNVETPADPWQELVPYGLKQDLTYQLTSVDNIGQMTVEFSNQIASMEQCNSFVNGGVLDVNKDVTLDNPDDTVTNMKWQCEQLDGTSLKLKLTFDDPLQVSEGFEPDMLNFGIVDTNYFVTKNGYWPADKTGKPIQRYIPRQIYPEDEKMMTAITDGIDGAANTALAIATVSSLFSINGISRLWPLINCQELRLSNELTTTLSPGNVVAFDKVVNNFIDFGIFKKDMLVDKHELNYTTSNAVSTPDNVDDIVNGKGRRLREVTGFRTLYTYFEREWYLEDNRVLKQLATLGFVSIVAVAGIVVVLLLKKLLCLCKAGRRIYRYLIGMLMFNSVLRCFIQMYFSSCLAVFSNLTLTTEDPTTGEKLSFRNTVLVYTLFVFIVVFPIAAHIGVMWYATKLESKVVRSSFSSLYHEIKTTDRLSLSWTFFFCLRRAAVAATIVWVENMALQMLLMVTFSLVSAWYLETFRPFVNKWYFYLEMMNECTILVAFYFQFIFTYYVPSNRVRYAVGWVYIALMCLNIAINLFLVIYEAYKVIHNIIKLRYLRDLRYRMKAKHMNERRFLAVVQRSGHNEARMFAKGKHGIAKTGGAHDEAKQGFVLSQRKVNMFELFGQTPITDREQQRRIQEHYLRDIDEKLFNIGGLSVVDERQELHRKLSDISQTVPLKHETFEEKKWIEPKLKILPPIKPLNMYSAGWEAEVGFSKTKDKFFDSGDIEKKSETTQNLEAKSTTISNPQSRKEESKYLNKDFHPHLAGALQYRAYKTGSDADKKRKEYLAKLQQDLNVYDIVEPEKAEVKGQHIPKNPKFLEYEDAKNKFELEREEGEIEDILLHAEDLYRHGKGHNLRQDEVIGDYHPAEHANPHSPDVAPRKHMVQTRQNSQPEFDPQMHEIGLSLGRHVVKEEKAKVEDLDISGYDFDNI